MCCHAAIAALPDWLAPSVQNSGAPAGRSAVARSQARDSAVGTIEPECRGMCRPRHPAYPAHRIERPARSHLGKCGAHLEEVRSLGDRGQEMQEVPLRQSRRIGARQADRQIEPQSHRAACRHRAQSAQEGRHLAHRRRCGQPPHALLAPRDGDPALARIDAPVRMCRDGRAVSVHRCCPPRWPRLGQCYSGLCARSSRRARRPGFFVAFAGSVAFSLARASASC